MEIKIDINELKEEMKQNNEQLKDMREGNAGQIKTRKRKWQRTKTNK